MKSYPVEYRQRVIALTDEGLLSGEITEALGVSGSWVNSINRLHRAGQPLAPKSRANEWQTLAKRQGDMIRARLAEHPGTTLEDLKLDLNLDGSMANIWHALSQLGVSPKNTPGGRAGPD